MEKQELICDSLAVAGTILQTDKILQIISMVLTIVSISLSSILKLINWYKKAKADKKITHEEIKDAVEIINEDITKIKNKIGENKDNGEN